MKLWQKTYSLNELMESFTVGLDYQTDLQLVRCDCMASIAHARTLAKAGIINSEELRLVEAGLCDIASRSAAGLFVIKREDEDCHTAIENDLVSRLGDIGKKVHTGRSRSDQILVALGLYEKALLLSIRDGVHQLIAVLLDFAEKHAHIPEIYATDEALLLVAKGMSFRDAYRQVGTNLDKLSCWDADAALQMRTARGNTANLGLEGYRQRLATFELQHKADEDQLGRAVAHTLGEGMSIVD